jgi:hypothetical protein
MRHPKKKNRPRVSTLARYAPFCRIVKRVRRSRTRGLTTNLGFVRARMRPAACAPWPAGATVIASEPVFRDASPSDVRDVSRKP